MKLIYIGYYAKIKFKEIYETYNTHRLKCIKCENDWHESYGTHCSKCGYISETQVGSRKKHFNIIDLLDVDYRDREYEYDSKITYFYDENCGILIKSLSKTLDYPLKEPEINNFNILYLDKLNNIDVIESFEILYGILIIKRDKYGNRLYT